MKYQRLFVLFLVLFSLFPACAEDVATRVYPLLSQLKTDDEAAFRNAVEQLRQIGKPAIPILISVSNHPDARVRIGVMQVFTNMRDARAFDAIVARLHDSDYLVRSYANSALQRNPDPRSMPQLFNQLKTSEDEYIVIDTIRFLGREYKSEFVAPLLSCLRRADGPKYVDEVYRVFKVRNAITFNLARTWLGDAAPGVRCLGVITVDDIVYEKTEALLRTASGDNDKRVRVLATSRLLNRFPRDEKLLAKQRAMLTDKDPLTRAQAATSLGRLRDQQAFPKLLELLKDPDNEVRLAVLDVLRVYHSPQSSVAVIDLLPNDRLRYRAILICLHAPAPGTGVAAALVAALRKEKERYVCPILVDAIYTQHDRTIIDEVIRFAAEKDHPNRQYAIKLLGFIRDQKAAPVTIAALEDDNAEVLKEAALACGRLQIRGSIDKLIALLQYKNDKLTNYKVDEIRNAACIALGEIGEKRAIPAIIASFDNYSSWAETGVEALVKLCGDDITLLASALQCKNLTHRYYIAEALGKSGDPRAVQPLIDALVRNQQTNESVNYSDALAKLKDERSIQALSQVFLSTPDPVERNDEYHWRAYTRQNACRALAEIGGPGIVETIMSRAESEDKNLRREVMITLGDLKDPKAIPAILKGAQDKEPVVRYYVTKALSNFHTPEVINALVSLLTDIAAKPEEHEGEYEWVAFPKIIGMAAADSLGRIKNDRVYQALFDQLTSKEEYHRLVGAYGLGVLGDARAVPALLKLLDDKSYSVQTVAIESLGKIGDKRAVAPLIERLKKITYYNRQSETIIRALGSLKDPRAVDLLLSLLTCYDLSTRDSASEALAEIGDKRAVEPMIMLVEREDAYYCMMALGRMKEKRAVPALIDSLYRDEYTETAAEALGAIGDALAVPDLIKMLGLNCDMPADFGGSILKCNALAEALKSLTRQDFGTDAAKWRGWYEESKKKPG